MIKLIVFDVGGTIIKKDKSESRYERISKFVNIDKQAFKEIYYLSRGNLDELEQEFKHFKPQEGVDLKKFFKKSSNSQLDCDIIGAIEYAYSKGLKIATLSNTNVNLFSNLKETKIGHLIDKEFYSFDIGAYKPQIEAFRYVENYYNYSPDEICLIGNSYSSDYIGALNAGWHAILYDNNINNIYTFINNLINK